MVQTFCPPDRKLRKEKNIYKKKYVGKTCNLMNRQMHAEVYNKNASWSILHENENWACHDCTENVYAAY